MPTTFRRSSSRLDQSSCIFADSGGKDWFGLHYEVVPLYQSARKKKQAASQGRSFYLDHCNEPPPQSTIGRLAYGISEAPPDRFSIVGIGDLARCNGKP